MAERLSLEEIQKRYPDQWVGLTEVEWELDNDASIKSAVVICTDKTKNDLTRMMIESKGKVIGRYTTPEHMFQLGAVGYFG